MSDTHSLGDLFSGTASISELPLSSLAVITIVVAAVLLIAICKFNLIPGLDEKIPFLKGVCAKKKEVCFAGECCETPEDENGL